MPYRREIAIWLSSLLVLAGCSLTGKSQLASRSGVGQLANAGQANKIHISYRTRSDRLNLASADVKNSLPDLTDSQLHLHFPHPSGRTELALATLVVLPREKESSWLDRWRDSGGEDEPGEVLDRRVLDIPARNAQAIVDQLRRDNFFQRSKPFTCESHLGVELDAVGFAKDFRSVDELDSLIMRVYRESQSGIATPPGLGSVPSMALRRLPPTHAWMR